MASKKAAKVNKTNPTFVVGQVYLVTNGVVEDTETTLRETHAYARYVGPSGFFGHILEDGNGESRYANSNEIESV
jgi:hypothetical protein